MDFLEKEDSQLVLRMAAGFILSQNFTILSFSDLEKDSIDKIYYFILKVNDSSPNLEIKKACGAWLRSYIAWQDACQLR